MEVTRTEEQIEAGLKRLREPFEKHLISLLPKPFKKDSDKGKCAVCGGYHGLPAAHLEYVGHASLTHRLLEVDPYWTWTPLALDEQGLPRFDKTGGLWIKLTVLGMTRLGYGNAETSGYKDVGSREKEVTGDALRNAGMRFGAALDLWHKGDLYGPEEEFPEPRSVPKADAGASKDNPGRPSPGPTPKAPVSVPPELRDRLRKWIHALATTAGWTDEQLKYVVKNAYGYDSTNDLSEMQIRKMKSLMEMKLAPDMVIERILSGK